MESQACITWRSPIRADGRWRDVLRGDERSFDPGESVARLVGESGLAVFERL